MYIDRPDRRTQQFCRQRTPHVHLQAFSPLVVNWLGRLAVHLTVLPLCLSSVLNVEGFTAFERKRSSGNSSTRQQVGHFKS